MNHSEPSKTFDIVSGGSIAVYYFSGLFFSFPEEDLMALWAYGFFVAFPVATILGILAEKLEKVTSSR